MSLRSASRRCSALSGLSLGALLLVGCAAPPQVVTDAGGDNLNARRALEARRAEGPVIVKIDGQPFGQSEAERDALVTQAMAKGVRGLSVRFTTDPSAAASPEPHLAVILNPLSSPPPKQVCVQPESVPTTPVGEQLTVVAAFCQGDRPLGTARAEDAVTGPDDRRFKRLLWRTAAALFPDDYVDNYGFNLLPGIDFGVGGGFGF